MQQKEAPETFYAPSRQAWRAWLQENHRSKPSVWLICYKMKSGTPSLSWSEAVDEALCFGWIDSTRKSIDHESFMQFFCPRKPKSVWSRINKAKVLQLIEDGLMAEAGYASIETAKQNGSWLILDEVEDLNIPADLAQAFEENPGSMEFFTGLSKSARKIMLQWIIMAKRPETRQKRVSEIATHAAQKLKPKPF